MPLIFYSTHDGNQYEAEVPEGNSVMQGAVDNMIDGILGECGGFMRCATCHCYVDEPWQSQLEPATVAELALIEATANPQSNSRLSCQITVTPQLDGLSVRLPPSQY